MLTCREITELATEYAEGALDGSVRRSFERHLEGCEGCRAWVRQLEVTARAAGALPPPPLPPELAEELMRRFDAWQGARPAPRVGLSRPSHGPADERRPLLTLPALAAAMIALVALSRHPSAEAADWVVGAGLAGVALLLPALARRLTPRFALGAASAALAAALLRGGAGPLSAAGGLECLLTEAAMAGGAVVLAGLLLRRGPGALLRTSLGPWAVAGALAGDAALQVTCAHHASLPHLLAFHVGGVLVLMAVAWLLARRALQPA